MEQKNVLRLIILIFVLIIAWSFALKPKKVTFKSYDKNQSAGENSGEIDLRKIEENFEVARKRLDEISKIEKPKINKIFVLKDPLRPWLPEKKKEEKVVKEEKKVEPKKPDFYISGIVYDEKKPYVIINDEVKSEGEKIENFTIQKIYSDRIVVKDEFENYFVVKFDYEKGEKKWERKFLYFF